MLWPWLLRLSLSLSLSRSHMKYETHTSCEGRRWKLQNRLIQIGSLVCDVFQKHFASSLKNFVKNKTVANGKRKVREGTLVGRCKHTSVDANNVAFCTPAALARHFNKESNLLWRNIVGRSRNVYTFSAVLTAWHHFTRRQSFYGDLTSLARTQLTHVFT